jgi:hypothetical protein
MASFSEKDRIKRLYDIFNLNRHHIKHDVNVLGKHIFKGSLLVPKGHGITKEMVEIRKKGGSTKYIDDGVIYNNIIITEFDNKWIVEWKPFIYLELFLTNDGTIRLHTFFYPMKESNKWINSKKNNYFSLESSSNNHYAKSILGMNLIYYFIRELNIKFKYVGDSHFSKTTKKLIANNTFYREFKFLPFNNREGNSNYVLLGGKFKKSIKKYRNKKHKSKKYKN